MSLLGLRNDRMGLLFWRRAGLLWRLVLLSPRRSPAILCDCHLSSECDSFSSKLNTVACQHNNITIWQSSNCMGVTCRHRVNLGMETVIRDTGELLGTTRTRRTWR